MACSSLGVAAALFLSSSLGVVDAFSISAAPLSGRGSASSASIGSRRGADMGVPATMPPSLWATALHAASDPDRPADSLVGVHGGGGADGGTSSRRRRTTGSGNNNSSNSNSNSNSNNKSNKRRAANAGSTRGGASPASQSPAKNRRSNNANNQGDRRRRRNDHPSQSQRPSRATASAAEAQRRNREQRLALRSKLEEMQRRSGQGEELSRE